MIEILYPEICNLYGDSGNILLMSKMNLKLTKTLFNDEPYFVKNDVKMIYMGPTPEDMLEQIISKLEPYKKRIEELIKNNVYFLCTGNALDIFSKEIILSNGKKLNGLGLIDVYVTYKERYNTLVLGEGEKPIVGYKSQNSYYKSNEEALFHLKREYSNNLLEGVRKNNFMGTNLLGPILVLNPLFTKELFKELGYNDDILYYDELVKAYQKRAEEYKTVNLI